MTRRAWISVGALAGSLGAWLALEQLSSEPTYAGKSLSFWVQQLPLTWNVPPRHPAAEALRHIGTNAVPCLLDTIQSGYPPHKARLARWAARANRRFPFLHLRVMSEFERWHRAFRALRVLGHDAQPAIPALVTLLHTGRYSPTRGDPRLEAAWVLANIRPEGIDCLIHATTDDDPEVRQTAVEVLGANGPPAPAAVVALIRCLHDEDSAVRLFAVKALVNLHPGAAALLPSLLVLLVDPDEDVRRAAAEALADCESEMAARIPAPGRGRQNR